MVGVTGMRKVEVAAAGTALLAAGAATGTAQGAGVAKVADVVEGTGPAWSTVGGATGAGATATGSAVAFGAAAAAICAA